MAKDNKHYISARESRDIARENSRTIRELQKKRAAYKREDYVTNMRDPANIVEFENLHTYFYTDNGVVKAVNGVSFDIPQGSTVGVVGESGCGKSVTSLSLMQLVQAPAGQIVDGSIRFRTTVRTRVGKKPLMINADDEKFRIEFDLSGTPVAIQAADKSGNPVYIVKKDKTTAAAGEPEQAAAGSAPLMVALTEHNLNAVRDEAGKITAVQAVDKKGNPLSVTAKVPLMLEETDENGKTVSVQAVDKKGRPRFIDEYTTHEEVVDVAKMPLSEMSSIRGREIAMIFQEPMTSLNPVFTVGYQLDEVTLLHETGADKQYAKKRSIEMLELVGIAMPEHVYKSYPHQLSGGMRQRVMIAMALCCNPKLIIADEPTTALDVTIQAQILDLLRDVKKKISGSIMLITHDLGVIAEMVDYVVVMYAGRIVEKGTVEEIFKNPMHPYTIGLQKSKPVVGREIDRLYSIPGNVPNPINMPSTCYFSDRCDRRCAKCAGDYPPMIQVSPTHSVACWLYDGAAKDKTQKAEKADKVVKTEKADKTLKADKVVKAEKADKTLKADKVVKTEKTDKAEKADKVVKTEKADKTLKAEKVVKAEKADKALKAEKTEKAEKTVKTENKSARGRKKQ